MDKILNSEGKIAISLTRIMEMGRVELSDNKHLQLNLIHDKGEKATALCCRDSICQGVDNSGC